ncbi:MAG: LysR family transcriptional regulator [Proteobacteria bacterium]|nr:LysR family transcriptional regulator [Pseudomonadota bacterium]NOG61114.1 LysR family transcriptional regulator [Pseudomonadota bacterium]
MDDELLKTFLEIHKTRHFGQAAENLFITQSAVSARIRQLEQEMGVRLFTRDRNNIRPTVAGEKLVGHAEEMLCTWNQIKTDIAVAEEDKFPLAIGGVSSLWDIYLSQWLIKFTEKNKDTILNCQVLNTETINQKIINRTLDFGFTYSPPQNDTVIVLKTLPIKFIMVSSRKGLTAEKAIKKNYIYVDWGTSFSEEHHKYFKNIPPPLMRIDVGRIAKNYIKKKSGTAYLPERIVKRDIESEQLYKVVDAPEIKRNAYIIYNNQNERCEPFAKIITG